MPIHPQLQALLANFPKVDYNDFTLEQIREIAAAPLPEGTPAPEIASSVDQDVETPNGVRRVRIQRPLGNGPKPTLVYIHGGGWVVGSPDAVDPETRRLAAYLDAVVVSISYRLAPEDQFPAGYEDALFLTQWAAEHVGELGGRGDQFAIAGESAGGNFAAAIAVALREDNILAGQLLLNPATDLGPTARDAASYLADLDPALTSVNTDYSIRQYLGAESSTDWRASPVYAEDFTGVAPAVIGISGNDPLHDQGQEYGDKLASAGVAVRVLDFDDLVHAYAAQSFLLPVCNDALVRTCEEFRTLLSWPTPPGSK
ncbi:alpha/beta hydrolase [Microbacterium sp. R1]|uniref:alpha/beta hydrolase n=1 Tax=Microbacterium TaxID=33882 RepID=UPI000733F1BA|nr:MULTISPECIES: alpha/beta hydrolase [Microbacterium]MBE7955403.1 alpha/beta hydrolase [Microbacterium sp. R1]